MMIPELCYIFVSNEKINTRPLEQLKKVIKHFLCFMVGLMFITDFSK